MRRSEVDGDVRKIAVLRANGIGDYVFSIPALEALRNRFPLAEIVLLGKAWHAEFLRKRPGPVDRAIIVPPCPGVGMPENARADEDRLARFFEEMHSERFDLAVQMHGGGRYSNPFVLALGARLTVGLKSPDAAPLDRWVPYIYFQQEIMRYLEVVSLAGAKAVALEPRLSITADDLIESREVIADSDVPLAVIHPGATDPRRHWPAEKFAAVADTLAARGLSIHVIGTEPERPVVDAVLSAMRGKGNDLCGELSVGGLVGLLSRASIVVSNDSGPLHLAVAVGTPSVGIFWSGNLINGGPLMRTRHRPFLSWQLNCSRCGSNSIERDCEHRESFVSSVPVDAVVDACLDLLTSQT